MHSSTYLLLLALCSVALASPLIANSSGVEGVPEFEGVPEVEGIPEVEIEVEGVPEDLSDESSSEAISIEDSVEVSEETAEASGAAVLADLSEVDVAHLPSTNEKKLKKAEHCNPEKCQLPNCRCSSILLNDTIPLERTPQLVMLTFDDAVTALNYEYIEEGINGRVNPDGCPVAATFYVSHEYTDYSKIHALWAAGHEIALHSITHNPLSAHWRSASVADLVEEFGGQRQMMAYFGNIDFDEIKGMRLPLFEMSANNSYEAMVEVGLEYDSSWPSQQYISPGLWPYTLEYESIQDCPIGPCPTASIPNAWVNPILNWVDIKGYSCAMVDACVYPPEDNVQDIFEWMVKNFEHNYNNNRAPFGVYLHAAWFLKGENYFPAYVKFLDYLGTLPDVYIVSASRVIEYTKNPKPDKPFDNCQPIREPTCVPRLCQLKKQTNGYPQTRYMTSCAPCPRVYPWLGNPLGLA